jgi:hypothetical protein
LALWAEFVAAVVGNWIVSCEKEDQAREIVNLKLKKRECKTEWFRSFLIKCENLVKPNFETVKKKVSED